MSQVVVTADVIAHAIVAAARSYGDCPVEAITARASNKRRALAAAAHGLCLVLGRTAEKTAPLVGCTASALYLSRKRSKPGFWAAAEAATKAAQANVQTVEQLVSPAPPEEPPHVVQEVSAHRAEPQRAPAPVSSPLPRPPVTFRKVEPPEPAATLRGRIIAVLRDAPCTAPSLAVLTDAKELDVSSTLRNMEFDGQVIAGPIPEQGSRFRTWALAEAAAA